jgi:hypothetical protein
MTKAEQYRATKPDDWSHIAAWLEFLGAIDPKCRIRLTDLGAVITFSDGSLHSLQSGRHVSRLA